MRVAYSRFCSQKEFLVPAVVLPTRENLWPLMGRRVHLPRFPDSQSRVILPRGTDFRIALEMFRSSDPQSILQVRNRDAAVEASVEKRPRVA